MVINRFSSANLQPLSARLLKQFRFPSFAHGFVEVLVLSIVFLAAGYISLGHGVSEMSGLIAPVVTVMMLCMVASGVYRREITNSIMNIYVHSLYGFVLASFAFIVTVYVLAPEYLTGKFVFFFLFFAFFVVNTLRPLISGADFREGSDQRSRRAKKL